MEKIKICLLVFPAMLFLLAQPASSQESFNFSKGGNVHEQVIYSWNHYYRDYFNSEIQRRLFKDGDVYVLYDVQMGGLQSFVEMTRRCKDLKQINEVVDMLNPIFSSLQPISSQDSSTGWICTGGNICTAYNYVGKEVPLCSSQFLGLLGAVATTIVETIPEKQRTPAQRAFISQAFNTMAVQLNRWLSPGYFKAIQRRFFSTPADTRDGSTRFFFSDKDLWHLTILSDLAELHTSGVQPIAQDGRAAFQSLHKKKEGIRLIFDLFLARTTLTQSANGTRADLDRGFWKYFFDNRYAHYEGTQSPVVWKKNNNDEWQMITVVPWDSTYLSDDAGWDISHSRRLVPAFETFVRNRNNIKNIWGYDNPAFDPVALRQAYANQITEKIWNEDDEYPLFSNYWSGDNGWYRVAYANQTGRQFAGYPPYGMNKSMPLGGYPVWGAFHPVLKTIFRNIFSLSQSEDSTAKSFMSKYYPGVSARKNRNNAHGQIHNLSFLSDLVEISP
ncbi:MAG: hypothetical protein H3C48_07010 [Chitinophagaceae bacterium]|nr:hypothetical protein [Chitinophagaceae bacterium]